MENARPKNQARNRILAICGALVIIVVALVIFMNANSQRIVEQNTQYLETSSGQTARRVNDTFTSSLQSVQTAAATYEEMMRGSQFDPQEAANILNVAQFDHTFFISADGTAYNDDGETASALDREYYQEGMKGHSGMCFVGSAIFDGQNAVVFYVPVKLNGEIVGIMASVLREESLTELMFTEFYDQITPTYLCQQDGTIVAQAGSIKPEATNIDEVLAARGLDAGQLAALNADISTGTTTSFTYSAPEGTGNTFIMKLPDYDWMLIRSFPASITSEMVTNANLAGVILVAGILVAALIVIIVLMIQARRENKELLLERQEATRIIDASTNLFNSLFTVDLVKGTYEFLKNDNTTLGLPASGKSSDLRAFFDQIIDLSTLNDEEHATMNPQVIKETLRPGTRFIQTEWRTTDREDPRWYQASLLCLARDGEGDPTSILVAIQDVTDAKSVELASRIALEDAFKAASMLPRQRATS